MKLFTQHVVRGDYWVPTNCSLTVNGGVASLIAWLDHSCQKTEVGGKQGHAPCRRILLQQIPMTMRVNPAISVKGTTPEKTESLLYDIRCLKKILKQYYICLQSSPKLNIFGTSIETTKCKHWVKDVWDNSPFAYNCK